MRETMRLYPTASMRMCTPLEDTVIGGKYAILKDTTIRCLLPTAMRDPSVDFSNQAELFKPERMMDGKFEALPVGSLF